MRVIALDVISPKSFFGLGYSINMSIIPVYIIFLTKFTNISGSSGRVLYDGRVTSLSFIPSL